MTVGIAKVSLRLPQVRSLKEKRRILKGLKDFFLSGLNIRLAEVGDINKWNFSVLGFSIVGNDKRFINSYIDRVFETLKNKPEIEFINGEFEILDF